jgi:hypothetical protein
MSEHRGVVTHELLVLIARLWLLHRWVVSLSLQIRHHVGQVLEKLVCVWKNCCMAGSICTCWGALPGRFTPDPDLVFTI